LTGFFSKFAFLQTVDITFFFSLFFVNLFYTQNNTGPFDIPFPKLSALKSLYTTHTSRTKTIKEIIKGSWYWLGNYTATAIVQASLHPMKSQQQSQLTK